ncbi:MAG: EF-P lysine aminoacylase EpmA [Gammaproteobacteria bacterium]|nr:EF-P lysine aminoacylase EpmA [Gammaproteobacteria bacterium]
MRGRPGHDWRPAAGHPLLRLRARMLADIRGFFAARDVLEVETPLLGRHTVTDPHIASYLVPVDHDTPGATAVRHLQTSPEFAMKRLLAAGSGDIYQICKAFRRGEAGSRHNPEFTLVEWYRTGFDHLRLMAEVAEVVAMLLQRPLSWARRGYDEVLHEFAGLDPRGASLIELGARAVELGLHPSTRADMDRDELLDFLFSTAVQPRLGHDRLDVVDRYPPTQAALARIVDDGSGPVAERFELFHEGLELANGYHELADPGEQRMRMKLDRSRRRVLGLPDCAPDERLLAALEAGLPECAGVALGFDRLVMLRSGESDIRRVLAFPYERA